MALGYKKEIKIIQTIAPFGIKTFNETIQLLIHCKRRGISSRELLKFWTQSEERRKALMAERISYKRNCPKCGNSRVALTSVREPKGKANVHGWKSYWCCLNDSCNWEEFSLSEIKEEAKKYSKEVE